jgi:hypothetical protein
MGNVERRSLKACRIKAMKNYEYLLKLSTNL